MEEATNENGGNGREAERDMCLALIFFTVRADGMVVAAAAERTARRALA